MPKLSSISGRKLLKALGKVGFVEMRQKGSHVFLAHPDGKKTVVPIHGNKAIPPGTLAAILRDIKITKEELAELI